MKPVILIMIVANVMCQPQPGSELLPAIPERCYGSTDMHVLAYCFMTGRLPDVNPPWEYSLSVRAGDCLLILYTGSQNDMLVNLIGYKDVSAARLHIQQDAVNKAIVFASVYMPEAEEPPPHDLTRLYRQCCVLPPFFTREIAKECGASVDLLFVDKINNVTGFKRKAFDCDHWKCVLDKYGLFTQYGDLDDEKYYGHLDLWVGLNPMFGDAMAEAKVYCKEDIRPYLPLKACEFFEIHGCIRNYLNVDCPVTIPTKECDEKTKFYKECREFLHRRK